ncbi:MAG TPA: hypothetical protein VKP88_00565 [Candidatus Paceibacterota bacterium]|nr:hypothetical protein [Candidatus Paceibacterota bacterium]
MSLADIREGLGTNLETISGIRVYEEIPDNAAVPCAVIQLRSVTYDEAFQRGLSEYSFVVRLIVTRVTERRAQRKLDQFIDDGARSVKTAIQSDLTLGGAAFDCRVTGMDDADTVTIGGTEYMAADFAVTVYAE